MASAVLPEPTLEPADVVEHLRGVVVVLERWTEPQAWHELAACRGLTVDLFFPVAPRADPEAIAACARCPVIDECSEAGQGERFGVWGGLLRVPAKNQGPGSPLGALTHRHDRRRANPRDRSAALRGRGAA